MNNDSKKSNENIQSKDSPSFSVVSPRYKLSEDVILSADTQLQLEECLARLRHHNKIYVDWNFRSVDPLGRSAILNFYGEPGTGKTMAAEALAGTLEMPFIHIGIAELESKYMGDTSKNIQAAFKFAYENCAVLFFDEADTLLGKRLSSVTQGVDNEVNAMRSTLLVELERFDGIVIFATNFAKNYDEAFRSRISYHVNFSLPDLEARKKLWDRMIVKEIPLKEDRARLIDLCAETTEGFSGREIRTCMRITLPKVIMHSDENECFLSFDHIRSSIQQIRKANTEVGSSVNGRSTSIHEVSAAKNLLGIN